MTFSDAFNAFSTLDIAALAWLLLAWGLTTRIIEHPPARYPSVGTMMARYRRDWMINLITRQPRMFDSMTLATLRQGPSFFGSATLIAIGGCLALLGNTERLMGVATDLSLDRTPVFVWEIRILVVTFFLMNAFLKFVWSHRLFGYCAVIMAAVPNDVEDPLCLPRAKKAAEINITAARSFNRGLRSVYFALASVAWLLGAGALIASVLVTCLVLLRREFASNSRAVLLMPEVGE